MISDSSVQLRLSSDWPGPSFWALAVSRRGGVVILGSEAFRDRVSVWQRDTDGRVLSLLITIDDIDINLVNVYAPTRPAERRIFLQSLHTYFFPNSRFIVGGDFNCYDSHLDKLGSAVIDSNLSDFKSAFRFRDAWRSLHPKVKAYTWFSPDLSVASRLDSFMVSSSLTDQIESCDIVPCVFSDHNFVTFNLVLTDLPLFGPGVWKLNIALPQDSEYCSEIVSLIDFFIRLKHTFPTIRCFWEFLKFEIKSLSISFARLKRNELSRQKVLLTN